MGVGSAESPTISNFDRCLVCYGPHSHSDPSKSDGKGITFELKNLKDIFMKIFGIQFLPHFSQYGPIHMCYNCHDEFLKVEKIYDEIEHGSEEFSHNFDAVREQFAFMFVESIMRSDYICNYVHGNAFDALRYLVFREWSGKFRKQEELKRGKHPGRITSSKAVAVSAPATITTTITAKVKAAVVENNSPNTIKLQHSTPNVPVPKPLPPPAAPPPPKSMTEIPAKSTTSATVSAPKPAQNNQAQAVKPKVGVTVPNAPAKASSPKEPVKQLPCNLIETKSKVDSKPKPASEKVGQSQQDSSSNTKGDKSVGSVSSKPVAIPSSNVIVNGNNTSLDGDSKDQTKNISLQSEALSTTATLTRKKSDVSRAQDSDSVSKTIPEPTSTPITKPAEHTRQEPEGAKVPKVPEKPSALPPPPAIRESPGNSTVTKKTDDTHTPTSSVPQSKLTPATEEPAKSSVNNTPVNNSQGVAKVPNSVTPISTPGGGIGVGHSTYILSADGQKLLSRSGKLSQNHKLIFVRRDPKTGKMIQVPKPNFDIVKGKCNGKEVIVRTGPPNSLPILSIVTTKPHPTQTSNQVTISGYKTITTTSSPSPSTTTTTPSHSSYSSTSKNSNSPLTPKIISVQSVRQAEYNVASKSKEVANTGSEITGEAKTSKAKDTNTPDVSLTRNETDESGNDNEDGASRIENFGLEISEAMEEDPEPPLLQQQQQLLQQQIFEKKQARTNSKSPRSSSSEESVTSQSQDTEIRSVRSGRRIKRTYDSSSSSWASGLELDKLVNQCVKDGRTDRVISPGKKNKYEIQRHGNLIIEPIDPMDHSPCPSPPVLDKESENPDLEEEDDLA